MAQKMAARARGTGLKGRKKPGLSLNLTGHLNPVEPVDDANAAGGAVQPLNSDGILAAVDFPDAASKERYAEFLQRKGSLLDVETVTTDSFEQITGLGRGAGGEVFAVRHKESGIELARKLIRLDIKPKIRQQIIRELRILHDCNSPYVVGFYGSFHCEGEINILMEWMDAGSLDQVLKNVGRIPESVCREICRMTLRGLVMLQTEHKIIHRDIKPSNILLNRLGEAKLCDFGVSGELINSLADTFVGTTSYMSPERVDGTGTYANGDVWSLGLTMVEIATGSFPIPAQGAALPIVGERTKQDPIPPAGARPIVSLYELLACIVDDEPPVLPPMPELFSSEFRDFVQACLVKDPAKRSDQATMLQHPWLSGTYPPVDVGAWVVSAVGPAKSA